MKISKSGPFRVRLPAEKKTSPVGAISKAQKYSRNIFLKVAQCHKKLERGHLGSLNVFRNRKFQKKNARGFPLIEFGNFRKKSHSAETNPKGGPFGLCSTFGSIKNLWFSARIEPTISCCTEN